jgi:hypothetical protein
MQSAYWLEKVLKMISLYVNALLCTLQHIVIHAMQLSGVNSPNFSPMYSLQQRIAIVKACVCTASIKETRDIFAGKFPGVGLPAKSSIQDLLKKYKYTRKKLCTKLALFTRLYRDARSTKHKIRAIISLPSCPYYRGGKLRSAALLSLPVNTRQLSVTWYKS